MLQKVQEHWYDMSKVFDKPAKKQTFVGYWQQTEWRFSGVRCASAFCEAHNSSILRFGANVYVWYVCVFLDFTSASAQKAS